MRFRKMQFCWTRYRRFEIRRMGILLLVLLSLSGCSSPELTLQPDQLQMPVSLDGEEDDYYEELTLLADGEVIKAAKARWRSEDTAVATVDRFGWVTSRGVGKTQITAKYKGSSAVCEVEVTRKITSDTPKSALEEP